HFILSLAIQKGCTYENVERKPVQRTETEQFIHVFRACVTYNDEANQQNYERLFTNYLMLGDLLGIGEEELQQAYIKKNEINYKHQNEGYERRVMAKGRV